MHNKIDDRFYLTKDEAIQRLKSGESVFTVDGDNNRFKFEFTRDNGLTVSSLEPGQWKWYGPRPCSFLPEWGLFEKVVRCEEDHIVNGQPNGLCPICDELL